MNAGVIRAKGCLPCDGQTAWHWVSYAHTTLGFLQRLTDKLFGSQSLLGCRVEVRASSRVVFWRASNRAQFAALEAEGYTHVRWLTARDNRVRQAGGHTRFDHRRMDGVTVPLGTPFVTPAGSRLLFPGDRSLGAPAGEVVNCRCTLVGVMLEETEYERPKIGVHFRRWKATPEADRRKILRGLQKARLLEWLKQNPLGEIRVAKQLRDSYGPYHGEYDPRDASIRLSIERSDVGQELLWGDLDTVSSLGADPNAAAQMTLVHETGHHVLTVLGRAEGVSLELSIREAWKRARPVSGRAGVNWKEYFCETHCAYVYVREVLKAEDPIGYNLVREIRRRLGVSE